MVAPLAYVVSLVLLIAVDIMGVIGMGAQRWIDLGPIQIQPSEMMKVALVMALAAYYARLDPAKVSRPFWVILPLLLILMPVALVLEQPDLGTAILLLAGGGAVMFLAGVSLWYFAAAIASAAGLVTVVLKSHGTAMAAARGLPVPPHLHLPRPLGRPARRRLPHHPGEDRHGLGRARPAAASCRARRAG